MTELTAVPKCIAPDCEWPADINSALCSYHRQQLQKVEGELLTDATRTIRSDMRQFEKLLYVEPPLHSAEIAHRAVMPVKEVRKLLKKFQDDRE